MCKINKIRFMFLSKAAIIFFASVFLLSGRVSATSLDEILNANNATLSVRVNQYDKERYNQLQAKSTVQLTANPAELGFQGSSWQVSKQVTPLEKAGKYKMAITFKCLSGAVQNASVSVDLNFSNWSRDNYVLLPAAAYNGNRYEAIRMDYMPFYSEAQLGVNNPLYLSDQPRLKMNNGYSRIQEPSGALSLPAIGFCSEKQKNGFWLATSQAGDYGDYGLDVEEISNATKAVITITSPVVREVQRFFFTRMDTHSSTDKTVNFKAGDQTTIEFIVDFFQAEKIQTLYNELTDIRIKHYPTVEKPCMIPLSEAFKFGEAQRNSETWRKEGYYGGNTEKEYIWKPAWIGGFITTYAMLGEGSQQSQERALTNLNWAFAQGNTPAGFYYYKIDNNGKFGLKPAWQVGKDLSWIRVQAEATYFVFKQLDWFKKQNKKVNVQWEQQNLQTVDAMLKIWKKYGQMGMYFDHNTGNMVLGNTTSGGIFPAALCEAYKQTGKKEYLVYAIDIANYYYTNFVSKGIVCGGPADAVQSFDAESSYGLLESFTDLYETTCNPRWLTISQEMANQFATWIMAYNYKFPANSTLGKMDTRTAGLVFANTQNNTGCPSICSSSGIALLKLYRATQNPFYIKMLSDITYATTQYMSYPGHEIPGYKNGWIYERGGTSDWDNEVGEIHANNSFPNIPLMLSYVELPGVYVNKETKEVFTIDQVKAKLNKKGQLEITNPTKFDAVVKVLAETKEQMAKPLGQNAFIGWKKVEVKVGKTVVLKLK